jgi:hypothetical protein
MLRVMLGQGAELPFGEVLRGDVEGPIETGTGVFPGNYGGEFDEFGVRKVAAESRIEFVRNMRGSASHGDGETQDSFLALIEMLAGFEFGQVVQLIFVDSGLSAHGRMNINSKGTADHQRSLQLREFLEVHRD